MSVSQEIFNQYRESRMIEILQKIAKSEVNPFLAFKGGTALRLFWGLPRFSQDIDYTLMRKEKKKAVYQGIQELANEMDYEITDAAIKFRTILFEFLFRWEGPNFRLKVEISNPIPEDIERGILPVRAASLRGVPITILSEERLTAQKFCAFLEREAPRDLYDFWFILEKRLKIDWPYVLKRMKLKKKEDYLDKARQKLQSVSQRKLVTDLGQLVSNDQREWLKTTFLVDLKRLMDQCAV